MPSTVLALIDTNLRSGNRKNLPGQREIVKLDTLAAYSISAINAKFGVVMAATVYRAARLCAQVQPKVGRGNKVVQREGR